MRSLNIVISFITIILLSGCINISNSSSNIIDYSNLNFDLQNIPEKIENGQNFDALVIITNNGKYTINSEELFIRLLDTAQFGLDINNQNNDYQNIVDNKYITNSIPIKGKFLGQENGDIFTFEINSIKFNTFLNSNEKTVFNLEQCHKYNTQIFSDICISKDSYGQNCNSNEKKVTETGSNDIQIKSYEQINSVASGPNVYSTFKIKGKYNGLSQVSYNKDLSCLTQKENNIILIDKIQIGSKIVDNLGKYCGSNLLYLDKNNEFEILCKGLPTYDVWTRSSFDFTEKITITLSYLKSDIISKDLTIL